MHLATVATPQLMPAKPTRNACRGSQPRQQRPAVPASTLPRDASHLPRGATHGQHITKASHSEAVRLSCVTPATCPQQSAHPHQRIDHAQHSTGQAHSTSRAPSQACRTSSASAFARSFGQAVDVALSGPHAYSSSSLPHSSPFVLPWLTSFLTHFTPPRARRHSQLSQLPDHQSRRQTPRVRQRT